MFGGSQEKRARLNSRVIECQVGAPWPSVKSALLFLGLKKGYFLGNKCFEFKVNFGLNTAFKDVKS